MKPIIIIGAGGHAKVIADAILACGRTILGFTSIDYQECNVEPVVAGLSVLGTDEILRNYTPTQIDLVNGLGGIDSSGLRRRVQERLEADGWKFIGVRHPSAVVSPHAELDVGVQLLALSVIQAGVRVGAGSIINTAAVVEHDSALGMYVHVAPRALLCGNTKVESYSHIGAGATVIQGLKLGSETVVGAGAVVVEDFPGGGTLVGVPARRVYAPYQ
jgi:sugar O-acyltransferase (sialic acid O-acetyltransferase NeuD family)